MNATARSARDKVDMPVRNIYKSGAEENVTRLRYTDGV